MRFHVQLLNPYPPGIIKTKHWRFNVQYLNPHPPHVMSCDQRPTPGGWHVAWCGKEIGPQHPKIEVEAAILASKRLRSGFEAARMSGIIVPDMRMSGIIIPDMQHQARKSKSKQPLRLRSRFEARMAASTSTLQLPLLPGLAQARKSKSKQPLRLRSGFEASRILHCQGWVRPPKSKSKQPFLLRSGFEASRILTSGDRINIRG